MNSNKMWTSIVLSLVLWVVSLANAGGSGSDKMVRVDPTPDEKLFWTWLIENGANCSNIAWPAVHPLTGSRGVMATRDIPGNNDGDHVYIKVPEKLMVTEKKALEDPEYGEAIRSTLETGHYDLARLALYLIFQSTKPSNFFYPYTQILQEPSMLSDWTEEEQAEVQDSRLLSTCDHQREEWKEHHRSLPKEFFPSEIFTWEKYHWAIGNVNQRAFGIRDNRNEFIYNAMVPGADLLNHVNIGSHYKMVDNAQAYVLYPVDRTIRKNEECYNGYGLVSNAHLLQSYGFALKGNRLDQLDITDPLYAMFQDLSAYGMPIGYLHPGQAIRQFQDGRKTWKETLKVCVGAIKDTLRNNLAVTSLEEDFGILRNLLMGSSWRKRFALHHRISQKLIGESYMQYCKQAQQGVRDTFTIAEFDLHVMTAVRMVEKQRNREEAAWFELPPQYLNRMFVVEKLEGEAKGSLKDERAALAREEL